MSGHYHFIGIGGIGMSGLARLLLDQHVRVSGSDIKRNDAIDELAKAGATIYDKQSERHIHSTMTVVYSSDIKQDNPEYVAAIQRQCRVLHRADLLVELAENHQSIAVAGTHGKTTVSALLATVLFEAGADPSFAIGGTLPQFQANSRFGKGKLFVLEADESDRTFLKYFPFGAIVTNIDNDHLINYDNSEQALIQSFKTFMSQTASSEHLFWCGDDRHLRGLNLPGQRYGFEKECDWRIKNFEQRGFSVFFDLERQERVYRDIEVALMGEHNALNSAAVFGLALTLKIPEEAIRRAFRNFQGVRRRAEKKGVVNGALFLDDYAHHPTEIQATLRGIREAVQEKRLIAVFQPHRYSRVKDCLGQYGSIFDAADETIVTDIYGAGETPLADLSYHDILAEIKQKGAASVCYVPRDRLSRRLAALVQPHDIVVTLGAGDVTNVGPDTMDLLSREPFPRLNIGLVFGGSPTEHEISIRSAKHFRESFKPEYYQVEEFGITKKGNWIIGNDVERQLENILAGQSEDDAALPISEKTIKRLMKMDVLVPVLHGPLGEDGTIQGFFELLKKAYVGCNHCAASIAMDKLLCKKLAMQAGIQTAPFVDFSYYDWQTRSNEIQKKIIDRLPFPVFVKPTHLGSTVGVVKVDDPSQLAQAILHAFRHDACLIVEKGIQGREIEFAVLGNDKAHAFPPGEILTNGSVYDYKAKYSSQSSVKTTPCAQLSDSLIETGRQLAVNAYQAIGCSGLARVDFFLEPNGTYWFNEINPLPGFTSTSLYPQICRSHGLNGSDLMDRLIVLALHRKRRQRGDSSRSLKT